MVCIKLSLSGPQYTNPTVLCVFCSVSSFFPPTSPLCRFRDMVTLGEVDVDIGLEKPRVYRFTTLHEALVSSEEEFTGDGAPHCFSPTAFLPAIETKKEILTPDSELLIQFCFW